MKAKTDEKRIGQRFVVVNAEMTFGDYKDGDRGVIRRIDSEHVYRVTWDNANMNNATYCDAVYPREIVFI